MKNKFKKVIAASLAVSVLLAFTGCGNNQAPSADNKNRNLLPLLRQIPQAWMNKAKKEMTFISRKIRFLLITKMPGTRYLVL